MEYVIIQICGKQYLLKKNQYYNFENFKNFQNNQVVYCNKILLLKQKNLNQKIDKVQIGLPLLSNLKIALKYIQKLKKKKLIVLKTKPKKKYTRIKGHKKTVTRLLFI